MLKAGYIKHTVNKTTFSEQCYYVFGDLLSAGIFLFFIITVLSLIQFCSNKLNVFYRYGTNKNRR